MKKTLAISLLFFNALIGVCLAAEFIHVESMRVSDRILILAPHPDDETIACAGIIQDALRKGALVHIAYLTNGDHNEFSFIVYKKKPVLLSSTFIAMGEVRRKEAISAMRFLGLDENQLTFLGYPDFGTLAIFRERWGDAPTYMNLMTRISKVPYKENLSYGAPYKGESILKDLKTVILKYRPNRIFVSHPADANVDHKALYLFLQIALVDLKGKIKSPKVYPYLVHAAKWPEPRGYRPDADLRPPQFLDSQIDWLRFPLDAEMIEKKKKAVIFYKSQTGVAAGYLLSFVRTNELFGDYPVIRLKQKKEQEVGASLNLFADSFANLWGELQDLSQGKGTVSYAIQGDDLVISIAKPKQLKKRLGFIVYLFGYNRKVPFAEMPKIHIFTLYNRFKVFNRLTLLKEGTEGITLSIGKYQVVLKVPLKLLGDPEFILSSIRADSIELKVNSVGFHRIEIER